MQDDTSLRIVRPAGETPPSARRSRPLSEADKREIFKGIVVNCLDAGFLRYSRRQELLKVAQQLGIAEFEACLLIAEAQFNSDAIDPAEAGNLSDYDVAPVARQLSTSARIGSALLAAALIDLAIIIWLL